MHQTSGNIGINTNDFYLHHSVAFTFDQWNWISIYNTDTWMLWLLMNTQWSDLRILYLSEYRFEVVQLQRHDDNLTWCNKDYAFWMSTSSGICCCWHRVCNCKPSVNQGLYARLHISVAVCAPPLHVLNMTHSSLPSSSPPALWVSPSSPGCSPSPLPPRPPRPPEMGQRRPLLTQRLHCTPLVRPPQTSPPKGHGGRQRKQDEKRRAVRMMKKWILNGWTNGYILWFCFVVQCLSVGQDYINWIATSTIKLLSLTWLIYMLAIESQR